MEGITILSEQIARNVPVGLFVALCVLVTFLGIIGVWAILLEWKDNDTPLAGKICMSIIVAILYFVVILVIIDLVPEMQPYTKYQITIDDTVGFNAFHSQYEILNQVGQVFTVRLKEVLS